MCKDSNSFIALMSGSKVFLQQVLALLAKDLKTEWRTREIFTSMFVFAVLVLVVFNFAIGADTELIRQVASGVIWVALLFATVLGLQRAGQLESEEDSLQGVLLALRDRSALFVAKMIAQMVYLLAVIICILPLCGIWFRIDFIACIGGLGIVFALGILGLSIVGTLFAMITLHTRAREVMLPMLFLPVSVPLTIAAVYATAQLISGKSLGDIADYLTLMVIFNIVFFALILIVFDYIVEE
jgi:heme exporter protein B